VKTTKPTTLQHEIANAEAEVAKPMTASSK